jgi:hypothetical protein
MLLIGELCRICLFELIRVGGGAKFMKCFEGGASYKSSGTSDTESVRDEPDSFCFKIPPHAHCCIFPFFFNSTHNSRL